MTLKNISNYIIYVIFKLSKMCFSKIYEQSHFGCSFDLGYCHERGKALANKSIHDLKKE